MNNQKTTKYHLAINKVWADNSEHEFSKTFCEVAPTIIDSVYKNCHILFIGLNPSLRIEDRGTDNAPLWKEHKNVWEFKLENIQASTQKDNYFDSFRKLAKNSEIGNNWSYIDLLFVRHTSQKEIQKFCYESPAASEFIWNQLQITKQIIEEINPGAIIVTNKFAETLLGRNKKEDGSNEWMGLEFKKTENPAIEMWNNKPTFFTGFLKYKPKTVIVEIQNKLKQLASINM